MQPGEEGEDRGWRGEQRKEKEEDEDGSECDEERAAEHEKIKLRKWLVAASGKRLSRNNYVLDLTPLSTLSPRLLSLSRRLSPCLEVWTFLGVLCRFRLVLRSCQASHLFSLAAAPGCKTGKTTGKLSPKSLQSPQQHYRTAAHIDDDPRAGDLTGAATTSTQRSVQPALYHRFPAATPRAEGPPRRLRYLSFHPRFLSCAFYSVSIRIRHPKIKSTWCLFLLSSLQDHKTADSGLQHDNDSLLLNRLQLGPWMLLNFIPSFRLP